MLTKETRRNVLSQKKFMGPMMRRMDWFKVVDHLPELGPHAIAVREKDWRTKSTKTNSVYQGTF